MTSLHDICTETSHVSCPCGASPGQPCACQPGSWHLARVAHARRAGLLSSTDFASVIHDADVFTGFTTIHDPGAVL
jgi:hypothetical protein